MKQLIKNTKTIAAMLMLAISVYACVEPFDFETETFESALVVEATITDNVGFQEVKLSRSFMFEEDGPSLETNATIDIISDDGAIYGFSESDPGTYVSNSEFGAETGKKYQLKIRTSNGRSYSSTMEETPQTTTLDEIFAERTTNSEGEQGVGIFANSFDPTGQSQFYQYTYTETYKIVPPFTRMDSLYSVNDEFPKCEVDFAQNLFASRGSVCYDEVGSGNNIVLTATTNLNEDRVADFMVRFIKEDDPIIANRYSVLVNQMVVSNGAYDFYLTLRDFSGSGSLFSQTQPGFIEGNIENDSNRDENVIGYFSVATISSKRLFFDYEDFFTLSGQRAYFFGCGFISPPLVAINVMPPACNLPFVVQGQQYIYAGPNDNPGMDQGPYFLTTRNCGDCREFASEEVPDFWID